MNRCRVAFISGLIGWSVIASTAAPFGESRANDSATLAGKDWPTVSGDVANTRYSTLSQINVSNIKKLGGTWLKEFPTPTRTPPVIAGGLLYTSDATTIYALNPSNGATVWAYRPEVSVPARGGVALGEGYVFCGLNDSHIIALEQTTGKLVWTSYIGNADPEVATSASIVDFGPGKPKFNPKVGAIANAPTYVNGVVTSGLTGGDGGARGKISGLDAKTGRVLWNFYVIPTLGEQGSETWPADGVALQRGGGAVWTVGAADPDLGLVFYGTGNAVPQNGGDTRPGDNLYTASVVALDVKTGLLKWQFQLTHHDIWEMDVSTQVVLYTAKLDGKARKGLAVMRADGYLFLLSRESGKPIFPVEERSVQQDVRQRTALTQPFPKGADHFGPECADPEIMPEGFIAGCYFEPLYFDRPNVLSPITNVRQAPLSYDAKTGYFYVMGSVFSLWFRRVENPFVLTLGHPPGSKEFGIYAAIDGRTNKIAWQKRSPWGLATGSGALSTAGGLLFYMSGDGNLHANNASTGDELWQFQTGFIGAGTVTHTAEVPLATYAIAGEQYVVAPLGKGLWAFKLGGKLLPRPGSPPPATTFGFTGIVARITQEDGIAIGRLSSDLYDPEHEHYFDEFGFEPERSRVKVGQTIKWTNFGVMSHTIVSADGSWTTGTIAPGQVVSISIGKPGTYVFFSEEYPFAKAQLIVE
jgi:glucose dehydrogenase/plastocyanin